ncbi:hypothetical protein N9R04_05255 [Staphylococcus sp. SQ8-PEA]|uniref:Maebl n=1 Tax=Staphylococcus marylandisciuri TaxID=2981529 RepID=A0ABT2QQ78_9STAP|nr:hypothetical protein [Staphylococcus marylandisciuri]MCU5746129.1 hypothetical protein [Staphylococcus marylandisciuri]
MHYYNRDEFERGKENYTQANHVSRYQPRHFVFGFVFGTVIGSAIGLFANHKKKLNEQVPSSETKFDSDLSHTTREEQAIAEERVEKIRGEVNNVVDEKVTPSQQELNAQQAAIQQEVSNHSLADTSPVGQENDKVSETTSSSGLQHIDDTKAAKQEEIEAQQQAIQEEVDQSPSNQEGQANGTRAQRLASAARTKSQQLSDDSDVRARTQQLLASEPISSAGADFVVPRLDGRSSSTVNALSLAQAARDKMNLIAKNATVRGNTEKLLNAKEISKTKLREVPVLVKESKIKKEERASLNKTKQEAQQSVVDSQVEQKTAKNKASSKSSKSNDKVASTNTSKTHRSSSRTDNESKPKNAEKIAPQTHERAQFKEGHIIHNGSGRKKNSKQDKLQSNTEHTTIKKDDSPATSSKKASKSKTQKPIKSEKAKSKIDKRTFGDK